jgi:hypothetical protein
MNATELPQYRAVVDALAPVLYDLPGKIVAIDGRPGSGKTTLGRYLAWRFNVTLLEADLFLHEGRGHLAHRTEEIDRLVRFRLSIPRPIIVDSVAVLRLLKDLGLPSDFVIHVANASAGDGGNLKREVAAYEAEFSPRAKAHMVVEIDV